MGNAVSGAEHNDDLVDILRFLGYIQTEKIERVFRAIDRGDYVLPAHREAAYKDLSWKIGNIHLSAPCVYGTVMEGLSLEPGLSFLNIGSGTGYLSTMAGLILNHHGTNHGIELNKDCLEYAYEKLEEFKQKSLALDEFDFCEPVFMHGNCLKLEPNRQYDRVYCGAACSELHESFIKQFVKIGGILVIPYKENLLRIERVNENIWKHRAMLPVSFASLVIPKDDDQRSLQLPYSEPLSLQELSRCIIRCELRKLLWKTYPEMQSRDLIKTDTNKNNQMQHLTPRQIIPCYDTFDTGSSSEDDEDLTQLFVYINTDLKNDELVSRRVVRSIVLSRTNEYPLNVFDNMNSNSDEESSNMNNCDAINTTQSTTDTDSPSTSYQNNIAVNTISNSDNMSPLIKEVVNNDVANDQSSTVNTAGSANKLFQGDSDDDTMDLDLPTGQLLDNPNSETQNEINFRWSNENKEFVNTNDQNESKSINNDNGECSIDSSERNASMSDISNSSSSDENDDNESETNLLMDWFNDRDEDNWGLPAYKCNNDGYSNNNSHQPNGNKSDDQNLKYLPRSRQVFAHNVDINVFSTRMKDKISKLPLPTTLLLYINYNRNL